MIFRHLSWDSHFFGIKVGEIIPSIVDEEVLADLVQTQVRNGVKLIYWSSAKRISEAVRNRLGGSLVDVKTTLILDLESGSVVAPAVQNKVQSYSSKMGMDDFYSLAVQCGEFSRFSVDQKISDEKYSELYRIWLERSLRKEMADDVLVILHQQKCIGFITLSEKSGFGFIGLFVVDQWYRDLQYGEELMRAAQQWFLSHGCKFGRVVTQGRNVVAMNLYRKCGYLLEKQEYFYHFWQL